MKLKSFVAALLLMFASVGLASTISSASSVATAHIAAATVASTGAVHAAETQAVKPVVAQHKGFELIASAHADLTEPSSPIQAIGLLPQLIDAIKASNWGIVAALALMLLVYGIKSFVIPNASANWAAFLAAFLPVVAMLAASLYAGMPVLSSLMSALFVGAAASGFWEWVGKKILPVKK